METRGKAIGLALFMGLSLVLWALIIWGISKVW